MINQPYSPISNQMVGSWKLSTFITTLRGDSGQQATFHRFIILVISLLVNLPSTCLSVSMIDHCLCMTLWSESSHCQWHPFIAGYSLGFIAIQQSTKKSNIFLTEKVSIHDRSFRIRLQKLHKRRRHIFTMALGVMDIFIMQVFWLLSIPTVHVIHHTIWVKVYNSQ